MGTYIHKSYICPYHEEPTNGQIQKVKNRHRLALKNVIISNEYLESDEDSKYLVFTITFDENNHNEGIWQ